MKKKLCIAFAFFVSMLAQAQVPQGINYQGVARNTAGNALANTSIGIKFTILQSGSSVFNETTTLTTDMFGLYNHVIGSINTSQFSTINWAGGNMSIQIGIDPSGGSSYTTIGTTVLQSVPYALYAASSGTSGTVSTQSLSIAGNTLSISGGNSVTLPPPPTYTAGTGISIASGIISNTKPDQVVNLNSAGSATVTGTYPNYTVSAPAAANPQLSINSNTLSIIGSNSVTIPPQTLSLSSNTLFISNGNSVTLPSSTVSATAPLTGTGLSGNPLAIPQASAGVNGFLSGTDWNTFNNKLDNTMPSGYLFVGNASGVATRVPAGGDVSLSNTGVFTVKGLQTVPISTVTPTSNQILQYNGTAWSPAAASSLAWTTGGNAGTTPSSSALGSAANNNYIGTQDAKDFVLTTNNTERIRIASSGPIGINNQSPAAMLDIASSNPVGVNVVNSGVNSSAAVFNNTSNGNSLPALNVSTASSSGPSAVFSGGSGIQTNSITISGGTPTIGSVLTASNSIGVAFWSNPVYFSYSGSTTSVPNASLTTVTFSGSDYPQSPAGVFNGTTFTAPVAGLYHFDAIITLQNSIPTPIFDYQLQIMINTGTYKTSWIPIVSFATAGVHIGNQISVDMFLASGHTVSVGVWQNSTTSMSPASGNTLNFFSGHLVH
ncbi:MAG: hypothetical protein JST67_10105 [Bacteroidetes bacterium]|nr:hypothetical protein [Bacteroidota bacterium]